MIWEKSWKADPRARDVADRHYNRQKPGTPQFVPPGRALVLYAEDEELFDYYLSRGWDELFNYPEYKRRCVAAGTKITDDEEAQK